MPVLVVAAPRPAEACGGTFCDGGPMTAAVDQAAETVLFVRDGDFVEAHVQIVIDPSTDASKFAWVLPMPSAPEVSVGSQPLFDALLASTSPSFSIGGDSCWVGEDGGAVKFDAGGAPRRPDVHTEVIGAFEVTILDGGTVSAVMTWLDDNGYAQDPDAEPILADYLAQGYVLVAFKLVPDAGIGEIHPVVLRRLGDEPCVPLELTAIAAQDDMGVRAFFLGEHRWAPTNYRHVVIDSLRLPWGEGEGGYEEAVTLAVDEAPGGRAFVTEYAGPSAIVPANGIYDPRWSAAPFVEAEAIAVVELLNGQGLADCDGNGPCIVSHPLVVAMLRKYLPAPDGVNENDFYACLSCYADQTDFAAWDGPAFAAELDERVITPAAHASELLGSWPTLTRMFTTISPHEMTEDPTFHEAPDLPEVALTQPATRTCAACDDRSVVRLPDGREVFCDSYGLPTFDAALPWAERIEQIPPSGAPIVEVDNTAQIDAALATSNDRLGCTPGAADSSGSGDFGGSTSISASTDTSASEGGGAQDDEDPAERGCRCNESEATPPWWALAVLALIRRRRS